MFISKIINQFATKAAIDKLEDSAYSSNYGTKEENDRRIEEAYEKLNKIMQSDMFEKTRMKIVEAIGTHVSVGAPLSDKAKELLYGGSGQTRGDGIYDKLAVGNCTTKESIDAMTDFTCKLVRSQDAVSSSGFNKIVADSMISTEGMQTYYRLQGDLDSVGSFLESNAKILDAALQNPFVHLDADKKLDIAAHEFAAMCDAHVSSEEGAKMLANLRTTLCFGKDMNLADALRESDYFKRWEVSATQTPEDYINNTFGIASNAVQKSQTENVDFQSAQADQLLSNIDDSLENESEVLLVQ